VASAAACASEPGDAATASLIRFPRFAARRRTLCPAVDDARASNPGPDCRDALIWNQGTAASISSSNASIIMTVLQTTEGPVDPDPSTDRERRAAIIAACTVGGIGCAGTAIPIIASWAPSEREKAAGGPVDVDITTIAPGQMRIVEWQGKPVWILHRTPEMVALLKKDEDRLADPKSKRTAYPTPAYVLKDPSLRSIKPEFFVAIGICTHLGCSPSGPYAADENPQLGEFPGFVCPCHGSTFDLAGRVFKDKPASDNLAIPPYRYASDSLLIVGEETKA
jgi:ubiquinol-cytochrome c reductase iron-sulfur subunit